MAGKTKKLTDLIPPPIHISYSGPESDEAAHTILNELIHQGYVVVHWNEVYVGSDDEAK